MAYAQGDYEATERHCAEALALARRVGDAPCAACTWIGLGLVALQRAEWEEATAFLQATLPLLPESGEEGRGWAPFVQAWLGMVRLVQGDHEGAAPLLEEALALARRRGDRLASYVALYNLALVAQACGDGDRAAGLLAEGARLSTEVGDRANLAYCLEGLAAVAGARGGAERATRLFGAAEGLLEAVGGPVYGYYRPDRDHRERIIAASRSALGKPAFAAVWEAGRAMTFERAAAYALGDDEA
jgi:tetratricopeptide (TPR) repeat protein